ncbi:glycosyltransferase family 4 protein [Algoriphagus halophytocola]|uniref:Glycosyltransferase family 4 protein n=1 Tax=Algoriphagus halophytocola TaxID=2991499 RepID=A0ABY6MK02_9BACT|nr:MULTISPECIES: glycosyltransferase family 4 protein [unclassified Algoriphagus]UZD22524.1 glycosyltransferase family 4 protein [Algoriphagus sp. TR-M5]WBL43787.1 glycosyltransferase family 4 protein [Algoriphagus sp. TR-M9]
MIIYTYPVRTAFTDRDLEMISPEVKIKALEFTQSPVALPFYFVLQFFQLLWFLPRTTQYLCFFGGYHSVLPVWFGKVFGKKCTIQAGGTDCINMPEIGYGNFRKKWLRKATVYSFKNCSLILPVAESLVKQNYQYDPSISPKQGLLNLIPDLKTPIQVVHNGFDTEFWKNTDQDRLPNSFISVATGTSNQSRAIIKGYDLIEQLASLHPEYSFTLVGDPEYFSPYSNIRVLGKLPPADLLKLYNSHQFYLQLSTSEGFPNALGEAMACGCIPIGSAVGAIPEIIGNESLILVQKNFHVLTQIIKNLRHQELTEIQKHSQNQIQQNFSYSNRKKAILEILQFD